jgi:RNA polymerase sigma-70 factor (ECF subfamily)
MHETTMSTTQLLAAYRAGNAEAGNRLFHQHVPWLKILAQLQLESRFEAKFDSADLVQQTLLEAVKAFPQFRGSTTGEFTAWLRQILAHVLAHEIRRYAGTRKRDLGRERSLDETLSQASQRLGDLLPATGTSPSQEAARNERQVLVARALMALPQDHREVLILRNFQGLSHEEVARQMNRTPGAVRMLWVRALTHLQQELKQLGTSA